MTKTYGCQYLIYNLASPILSYNFIMTTRICNFEKQNVLVNYAIFEQHT